MRWAEIAVLIFAAFLLFMWFRVPANANPNSYLPCLPTNQVLAQLTKLGEERIWRGLSAKGHITEIWLNKKCYWCSCTYFRNCFRRPYGGYGS